MNLLLVRSGPAPETHDPDKHQTGALVLSAETPLPPRAPTLTLHALVDAHRTEGAGACRSAVGAPAHVDEVPLACPHDEAATKELDERVQAAARLATDGVLLDRPDAWYTAGRRGAGFCEACAAAFNLHLRNSYGEQYVPYDVLTPHAAADEAQPAPFWRELEAMRLRSGVEPGARLTRRVRDEVRRTRGGETSVGATLEGSSPASVLLAEKLDFVVVAAPVPSVERAGVASYEIFRAALGKRPLIALVDRETATRPGLVAQAAQLASATGAEISLPPEAPEKSHLALAFHRRFWKEFRARYRPTQPLAEVLLLYSPTCDHLTRGRHGVSVRASAEALTSLGAQYRVVLEVPRTGTEPVVLCDAGAIGAVDAARIERRVVEGASAIVVGRCAAADEDGRPLEGPLPELAAGLNRVGAGTVFSIDPKPAIGAERRPETLATELDRALESLLGRGRRAATVSLPSLIVKMFLDPEKKLDVHLVGRAFDPASGDAQKVSGAVVHLAGFAVSGARSGYVFTAEAPERKITLTPFGMGVQAALPDFTGAAILTIAR